MPLRELEQQIRRDIEDGIDSTGKKMTLCQLYAKQNLQRANVKKSTQKQREQLMRLLKEDKLGARSIDTIKPSDAKEWALRMKDKGFSYNTINNHKRSLKASFYIAIQDDCVRKNPFDFKLSEVLENDTKEKVALTEEQEQALLSFIKTDNVYHKHYDDVLILLKTGLRISELCGLTVADIDFKNEVVIIDHQLLKSKEQGYYIETPKTKSGIRQVPLSRETIQAFQRVMKKRPKAEPFVIDGQATIKVYGVKDGKADLSNLVATKDLTVNLNASTTPTQIKESIVNNVKDMIDVPASYLDKAKVPGPFLAGVNQVIPYEAFGGDGMLTRLILKSSDKAPWSDNGMDKNPALLPLEGLAKGQYFYEVDLNGNTVGKDGQALLEQVRANGTHTYLATVKVYGSKDGKPDLTNLIATRQVTIQLRGKEMATIPSQQGQMNTKPSETGSTGTTEGMMGTNHYMSDMKVDQPASSPMANMMKKDDKAMLPNTGEAKTATAGLGIFGLTLAGLVGLLGLTTKRED